MEKKKKVLIIEDEAALLHILGEKFTREGFTVLEAKNGKEGLKKALKDNPDIILLDIIMPIMDGMSLLKELRGSQKGQDIPVIIISNLSEAEKISQALGTKKGVIEYLVKSHWSMDQVVQKAKDTLKIYEMLKG